MGVFFCAAARVVFDIKMPVKLLLTRTGKYNTLCVTCSKLYGQRRRRWGEGVAEQDPGCSHYCRYYYKKILYYS